PGAGALRFAARRGCPAAAAPVRGDRRPGAVPPAGPAFPWPRDRRGRVDRPGGPGGAVKLTVVGCSGSFPGPDGPASCYLLEQDGVRVLLDLGSGALGSLSRHVDLDAVDAVVLSHLHADHCLDACPY